MNPVTDPTIRRDDAPVTRIEFTKDYVYETEGRGKGPKFKKGAVYDFPDDLAQRFIRRNVAERVGKGTAVTDKYLVKAAPAKAEEPVAITDQSKAGQSKGAQSGPAGSAA